jgi:hypothetical protein
MFGERDRTPLSSSVDADAYFSEYENTQGRSTAPGLYSAEDFGERLFSVGDRDINHHSLLFERTGLRRSQSAAPRSGSVGPPPGLGINGRSSESLAYGATENSFVGIRRPASAGVIGGQTTSPSAMRSLGLESDDRGAVRPAPKTLMDLIQEDFPSSPSPMYAPEQSASLYSPYPSEYSRRPRSSSPPSQYNRMEPARDGYGVQHQHQVPYNQQDSLGGITRSMDLLQVNARENYNDRMQQREYQSTNVQYTPQPQRSDYMGREYVQEPTAPRSMYATAGQGPRSLPPQQPGHYYDSQPVFYDDRQRSNAPPRMQTQGLPSGHALYVNAPAYGYGTLQYHAGATPQHQQPHRIVRQGGHPTHEYISVVPVQAGGQMAPVQSPQGQYAYWQQQEGPQPSAPTRPMVAYIATAPVAMARVPNSPVLDPPGGRRQKGGRSPKEKGGKGRRGGGGGRRSGPDTHKHAACGSLASPLLDEFRAFKNRDWTMHDIKGE